MLSNYIGAIQLVETITQDVDSATLPFTHNNIHEITYAQSGDTMFSVIILFRLVRTEKN